MTSHPSLARSVTVVTVIAAAAVFTAAVKFDRTSAGGWLVGVLPNFVCAAVAPLVLFLPLRAVRGGEYAAFVAVMTVGLAAYEFTQVVMPKRTFDWYDIAASAAGAVVALVLGGAVFLISLSRAGHRAV